MKKILVAQYRSKNTNEEVRTQYLLAYTIMNAVIEMTRMGNSGSFSFILASVHQTFELELLTLNDGEYISEENPIRVIDAYNESLDLKGWVLKRMS